MNRFCGKLSSFSLSFFWSLLPLSAPSGSGRSGGSQENTLTEGSAELWAQSQLQESALPLDTGVAGRAVSGKGDKFTPCSHTESVPWKHHIWAGCRDPSAFCLLPEAWAHRRKGCREKWGRNTEQIKHRAAQITLPKSGKPSWQILWRSAIAINNNMYHQLWWHCQKTPQIWFYPLPQSSLNLNFNLFHLFLFCCFPSFVFSASHPKMLGNAPVPCQKDVLLSRAPCNSVVWELIHVATCNLWDPLGKSHM